MTKKSVDLELTPDRHSVKTNQGPGANVLNLTVC